MTIAESLLAEFEAESANTRKSLERLPDDKLGWKPHEKSWTLGELAAHLATIPMWGRSTLETDRLDFAPDGEMPKQPVITSAKNAVEVFDEHTAGMRAALTKTSDEELLQDWTLLMGGKELFTMPRLATLRIHVFNHSVHHRAQLGVYLRLCDVAVPAIYGPSADEGQM